VINHLKALNIATLELGRWSGGPWLRALVRVRRFVRRIDPPTCAAEVEFLRKGAV
jgi:hypothetical protein